MGGSHWEVHHGAERESKNWRQERRSGGPGLLGLPRAGELRRLTVRFLLVTPSVDVAADMRASLSTIMIMTLRVLVSVIRYWT